MSYIDTLLDSDEGILLRSGSHPLALISSLVLMGLLIILVLAIDVSSPDQTLPTGWLVSVMISALLIKVLRWRSRKYIITNRRLLYVTGILRKSVVSINLEMINDVRMDHPPLGRLLGYGNLTVFTGNDTQDQIRELPDIVSFKKLLMETRKALGDAHAPPAQANRLGPRERLANLEALLREALLSEAEYQQRRAAILKEL